MKESRPFVVSLLGMAVSAAGLMLLIPSLFRSDGQGNVGAVVALACLTLTFAVASRYWRPSTSSSGGT